MAGRRTGGLGKGLDALIPNKAGGPSKEPAKKTRSAVVKKDKPTEKDSPAAERLVKISSVEPNLNQPRRHFDEDALLELSESIKQYGVLQPLLVSDKKDYFLLWGLPSSPVRRSTACTRASSSLTSKGFTM